MVFEFKIYEIATGQPYIVSTDQQHLTVTPSEYSFTQTLGMEEGELSLKATYAQNRDMFFFISNTLMLDNVGICVLGGADSKNIFWYGRIDTVNIDIAENTVSLHAHGISSMFHDMQMSYGVANSLLTPSTSSEKVTAQSDTKFGVLDKMCAAAAWQSNGTTSGNCFPHTFTAVYQNTGTTYKWEAYRYEQKNAYDAIAAYADNMDVPPFIFFPYFYNDKVNISVVEQIPTGYRIGANSLVSCGELSAQNTDTRANIFVNNQLDANGVSKILYTCSPSPQPTFFARQTTDHSSVSSVAAALTTLDGIPRVAGFTWDVTMRDDTLPQLECGHILAVETIIGGNATDIAGIVESITYTGEGVKTVKIVNGLMAAGIRTDPVGYYQDCSLRTSTSTGMTATAKTLARKTRNLGTPQTTI